MAVTFSATPIGTLVSMASGVLVSNQVGAGEVVTLVHRLGMSPHRVWGYIRSIVTGASLPLVMSFQSWNASQATINAAGGGPSANYTASATVDFVADFLHSLVQ